ncbi:MAG: cupin domain-containing protein [Pseudomonadales bacterium]
MRDSLALALPKLTIKLPMMLAMMVSAVIAFAETPTRSDTALAIRAGEPSLTWGPCPAFFSSTCRIAVLHGDPGQPNADVFFRVAPGDELPHHWHSSAERMVLVAGRLSVQYDGQAAVVLEPGMYAYGPPKLPHVGRCESDDACVLFIAFEGPVDAFLKE